MHYVFFDLDGTLTDSRLGIVQCIRHALTALGRLQRDESELEKFIGTPLRDTFIALLETHDEELILKALNHYRERYRRVGILENKVYDGVRDMLNTLRVSGYTSFVVTSKPTLFAEKVMSHFGLSIYFQQVYGSELDGTNAKKDDLIRHVLDVEQIAPSEAVMVGDRMHDVIGAKANGVASVAVLWGYGSPDEFSMCEPDRLVSTPAALPKALTHLTNRCS